MLEKKLIIMPTIGDLPYSQFTARAWSRYAHRHGVQFLQAHTFSGRARFPTKHWAKVGILQKIGRRPGPVEGALIVDADTMPMPGARNLFEGAPATGVMLAVDHVWKTWGHDRPQVQMSDHLASVPIDPPAGVTAATDYYNSGVMFWSATAAGQIALEDPWDIKTLPYDQDWINFMVAKHEIPVSQLPEAFNWHRPRKPPESEPGILHFTGGKKRMIQRIYRKYYTRTSE